MKQVKFKKIEVLEYHIAYRKTLYWFFAYPNKEISLTDITKLVGISKTTANKVVSELAKEEFLTIKELGNVWRISCDQQHPFNTTKKIPYNLELVYKAGIIEAILSIIPVPRSIILFGSYRKGDDVETSDLDIAVEVFDDEDAKIFTLDTIPQLGYRQNVKVNLLKFTRNKICLSLFANLCNGIVLYGFLEARP